jgi:ribosomal protein S18
MQEVDSKECKVCTQVKQRIADKTYENGLRRYVDETGKMWNGRTCPTCHKEKVKNKVREKRGLVNVQ